MRLQAAIIEGEDFKEIMPRLEAAMCRQLNIETVLKLMTLMSVTKSGFD